MDCSRNEACKNNSIMFLDFIFFVFKIKRDKKVQSCVGKRKFGFFCGKTECRNGAIIDLYSECQNGYTGNIGIILIGRFFTVRWRSNLVVRMLWPVPLLDEHKFCEHVQGRVSRSFPLRPKLWDIFQSPIL